MMMMMMLAGVHVWVMPQSCGDWMVTDRWIYRQRLLHLLATAQKTLQPKLETQIDTQCCVCLCCVLLHTDSMLLYIMKPVFNFTLIPRGDFLRTVYNIPCI